MKLLRITGRVRQFILLLKKARERDFHLICEELAWGEKLWWKLDQCSRFPNDLINLREKKCNKDGHLHKMSIFLDIDGTIRVCSRILRIDTIPGEIEKEPVVLDGDHQYTQKMIMHFHTRNGHQGIETLINELRSFGFQNSEQRY
ncbi:hypothetical protein JTB14_000328 [Gonioctena quinquepunctata]|nr:hypothetical protein JTB14_000328 [Gonioctena quinquepunctata]